MLTAQIVSQNELRTFYNKFQDPFSNGLLNLTSNGPPLGFYSGSFNPLHSAHMWIQRQVPQTAFELSICRIDKPPYASFDEFYHIVEQFQRLNLPLVITTAAKFTDKLKLWKEAMGIDARHVLMGDDTANRMGRDVIQCHPHTRFHIFHKTTSYCPNAHWTEIPECFAHVRSSNIRNS